MISETLFGGFRFFDQWREDSRFAGVVVFLDRLVVGQISIETLVVDPDLAKRFELCTAAADFDYRSFIESTGCALLTTPTLLGLLSQVIKRMADCDKYCTRSQLFPGVCLALEKR